MLCDEDGKSKIRARECILYSPVRLVVTDPQADILLNINKMNLIFMLVSIRKRLDHSWIENSFLSFLILWKWIEKILAQIINNQILKCVSERVCICVVCLCICISLLRWKDIWRQMALQMHYFRCMYFCENCKTFIW